MTTSAHVTQHARDKAVLFGLQHETTAAPKRPYTAVGREGSSFIHHTGSRNGCRLKETPVVDRGKIDRGALRAYATTGGVAMIGFRRTDTDRQVCRPVRMPGDPDKAYALQLQEYQARLQRQQETST